MNIKEAIGGLRDIEMMLLIYKAKYRLREPINQKLVETICKIDHRDELCYLAEAFNFYKYLRYLYRLTVAAEDNLNVEYLDRIAEIMEFKNTPVATANEQLVSKYSQYTKTVSQIIDVLINDL